MRFSSFFKSLFVFFTIDILADNIFDTASTMTQAASFESIFANLDQSLNQIYPVLISLCYLLGVFFILKAFFMLKKMGYKTAFMHAGSSMIGPAAVLITGVVLMYTPKVLEIFFLTLYGTKEVTAVNGWAGVSGDSSIATWESAIKPMIGVIQVIGLCAFIKGWVHIMKATGENAPPGNLSKGVMHVFAGVLSINITGTIDVINRSIGLS